MAYGSSQARGRIVTTAASLHHRHSNSGSEPHLQPTPQLRATLDTQPTEWGQGFDKVIPFSFWASVQGMFTDTFRLVMKCDQMGWTALNLQDLWCAFAGSRHSVLHQNYALPPHCWSLFPRRLRVVHEWSSLWKQLSACSEEAWKKKNFIFRYFKFLGSFEG